MFPESWQYNLAPYIDSSVKWMVKSWGPFFDAVSALVLSMLLEIEHILKWVPWWGWIIIVTAISWRLTRSFYKTLLPGVLIFSIGMFGLWEVAMETLGIVVVAVLISLLVGIPVGIAMSSSERFNGLITPVLDAMQTMPSLVYLIPALMLFGLGKVPAVFATVIYALPPVVRLTNLGIRQVSNDIQEAALVFGASPWQMLKEVRLPLAMPSIMAGINQTTMLALSMVVIASMIGAGGLGEEVLKATNRVAAGKGFEAGWAIVVLAIVIDRISQATAKSWEPPQR
ncbi:MAG TPA: choline ABC transporter permease subunit [Syntrophomonas sp.]|jgi:glycine betaine/proline transport system permease protein|nr:choline ABC transporter permease subunit [Syntrophomonas sp.]